MQAATASDIDAHMTKSMLLFDFEGDSVQNWEVVNDGVMGGRSQGFVAIQDDTLRFTGDLVTRGGGFTSVRRFDDFDLSGHDGLELRMRGNGRTFEVEINDARRYGSRPISRRAPFETTAEWQTVRVPFSALRATVFGRPVEAPAVRLSEIERIGFYIVDGIDGGFELEVDSVSAYRTR